MHSYDLSNLCTLVVDDSPMMRELLSTVLRSLGVQKINTAEDGMSAVKRLKTCIPDIIFLDLMMPRMGGLEFCRIVRSGKAPIPPFTPILVVSGFSDLYHISEARDAGANDFICKPISTRQIYTRIVNLIQTSRPFVRASQFCGPDRRRRCDRRCENQDVCFSDRREESRRQGDEEEPEGGGNFFGDNRKRAVG